MNFDPINWKAYNKPPYLFEWLSRGDTQKFVSFDDSKYVELEGQIYDLSNQWDIDAAKAILLDRIGKILGEPRDGNDDNLYRLLIKLRILLNTTNGSVNDIIKVIKFLYSSEVIDIMPKYPAALVILHDGSQEYINFNRILVQVIGAGIGYETQELYSFYERMILKDYLFILAHRKDEDSLVSAPILWDGKHSFDGSIDFSHGGIQDYLEIFTDEPPLLEEMKMNDRLQYGMRRHTFWDGKYCFDGTICYDSGEYIPLDDD